MDRTDLAKDQGIAVSDDDAIRLTRAADAVRAAIAATNRDFFDTEPAHFDRYQKGLAE